MSQELRDALTKAGWTEGRVVPTGEWLSELEGGGYAVVDGAEPVLRTFGGLVIDPAHRPDDAYTAETITFDPLGNADRETVAYWEHHLRMKLTPIAEVGDQSCLLLAQSGEMYTAWDRFLFKDGDSLVDALENTLVFARRRPIEIARMK